MRRQGRKPCSTSSCESCPTATTPPSGKTSWRRSAHESKPNSGGPLSAAPRPSWTPSSRSRPAPSSFRWRMAARLRALRPSVGPAVVLVRDRGERRRVGQRVAHADATRLADQQRAALVCAPRRRHRDHHRRAATAGAEARGGGEERGESRDELLQHTLRRPCVRTPLAAARRAAAAAALAALAAVEARLERRRLTCWSRSPP